jgi:HEAT repeat protein
MVFDTFRTDRSPEVRKEAAWTLRRHVTKETWRTLFDAWHHDSLHRHRCWACEIAADFGGPDLAESLSQLANDEDGLVRRAAKDALSRVGAV